MKLFKALWHNVVLTGFILTRRAGAPARSFSDLSGSPPLLWPTAGLTFRGLVRHTEPFCHRWARHQDSYLGLHGELPTLPPAPRTHQAVKLPTCRLLDHISKYQSDTFSYLLEGQFSPAKSDQTQTTGTSELSGLQLARVGGCLPF